MSTLAKINGEALAVPGLRIWGRSAYGRFAIIAQDEHGAAELWCDETRPDIGGVELHSPRDWGRFSLTAEDCEILGGRCWSDGSLSAWNRTFVPLVEARDSEGVLRKLVGWHRAYFGGAR
jgi:hypothetical protein